MKLILMMILTLVYSSGSYSSEGLLRAWEGLSAPEIMVSGFTNQFDILPLSGTADTDTQKFWSGPYWPLRLGGINHRWNSRTSEEKSFGYYSYSKKELKKLPLDKLKELSATEKYDILMGRYNYPLKAEVAKKVSPEAEGWEGICHGWVLASIHHNEPTPKTLVNPDGILVPFGSSDIKALLSYYYAESDSWADFVGLRCNFGSWTGGAKECDEDLNAGAFHIILANKLGLNKDGFVADVTRYAEVWNQPVYGYDSYVVSESAPYEGAALGTVRVLEMRTEIFYVNESEAYWEPVKETYSQFQGSRVFLYKLDINQYGEIIGGEWQSEERPDFLWQKPRETHFHGPLEALPRLLNDSFF